MSNPNENSPRSRLSLKLLIAARRYSPPNFMVWRPLSQVKLSRIWKLWLVRPRGMLNALAPRFSNVPPKSISGKPSLACPHVEWDSRSTEAGRIHVRIERIERRAIAAVAKTHFVDLRRTQGRKQAERDQLHPRRRTLRKLRKPRSRAESEPAQRKHLLASRERIAPRQRFVLCDLLVNLGDEAVYIVLILHAAGQRSGDPVEARCRRENSTEECW